MSHSPTLKPTFRADRQRRGIAAWVVDVPHLGLLPFLVFGFFAGVRPKGELQELEWRDVDLSDREKPAIIIRPEVSKTNRRRFVDLSPNAAA